MLSIGVKCAIGAGYIAPGTTPDKNCIYFCIPKMSTTENSILGLKLPTDPRWADLAAVSLQEILTDHAFCEQKAATQCISLIHSYSELPELVDVVAPVVTEEWGHFRMVVAEMKKRGYKLGRQRKDKYVNLLIQMEPKGSDAERMLRRILLSAIIEARSCERFRLLSENLEDEKLRAFYYKFMVSEAGHYRLFLDLALNYYPEERVKAVWQQWLQADADALAELEPTGDRIH